MQTLEHLAAPASKTTQAKPVVAERAADTDANALQMPISLVLPAHVLDALMESLDKPSESLPNEQDDMATKQLKQRLQQFFNR